MKIIKYILCISIISHVFNQNIECSSSVVTFFIKKAKHSPIKPVIIHDDKNSIYLRQPSFINGIEEKTTIFDNDGVGGITASYLGQITVSNKNGQITFPRKQQSDTIYILVTSEIAPIFIIGPTLIHHWKCKSKESAKLYQVNRKKNKELNIYYFDIKEIDIMENKDFPINSIIIYADPDKITIPTGVSLNTYSTNFILPDITTTEVDFFKNSLYTVSIKQYFEQIKIESKNDKPNIITIVGNQ